MAFQRGLFAWKANQIFTYHLMFYSGLYTTGAKSTADKFIAITDAYRPVWEKHHFPQQKLAIDKHFSRLMTEHLVRNTGKAYKSTSSNVELTCSDLRMGQFSLGFKDRTFPAKSHTVDFIVQAEDGHIFLRSVTDRNNFMLFCKQYPAELQRLGVQKVTMLDTYQKLPAQLKVVAQSAKRQKANDAAQAAEARILNNIKPKVLTAEERAIKLVAEVKAAKAYDESKAVSPVSAGSSIVSMNSPSSGSGSGGSSPSLSPSDASRSPTPPSRVTVAISAFEPSDSFPRLAPPAIRAQA